MGRRIRMSSWRVCAWLSALLVVGGLAYGLYFAAVYRHPTSVPQVVAQLRTPRIRAVSWDAAHKALWLTARSVDEFDNHVLLRWNLEDNTWARHTVDAPPVVPGEPRSAGAVGVWDVIGEGLRLVAFETGSDGGEFREAAALPPPPAPVPHSEMEINAFACSADLAWVAATSWGEGWVALWTRAPSADGAYELAWSGPAPLPMGCAVLERATQRYAVFVTTPSQLVLVERGPDGTSVRSTVLTAPLVALAAGSGELATVDLQGRLELWAPGPGGLAKTGETNLPPILAYSVALTERRLLVTGSDNSVRLYGLPGLELHWEGAFPDAIAVHPTFGKGGTPYVVVERPDTLALFAVPPSRPVRELTIRPGMFAEARIVAAGFVHIESTPLALAIPGASWRSSGGRLVRSGDLELVPASGWWQSVAPRGSYRLIRRFDLSVSGPAVVEYTPQTGRVTVKPLPQSDEWWPVDTRWNEGVDAEGCHVLCRRFTDPSKRMTQIGVARVGDPAAVPTPIGKPITGPAPEVFAWGIVRGLARALGKKLSTPDVAPRVLDSVGAKWLRGHRIAWMHTRLQGPVLEEARRHVEVWSLEGDQWHPVASYCSTSPFDLSTALHYGPWLEMHAFPVAIDEEFLVLPERSRLLVFSMGEEVPVHQIDVRGIVADYMSEFRGMKLAAVPTGQTIATYTLGTNSVPAPAPFFFRLRFHLPEWVKFTREPQMVVHSMESGRKWTWRVRDEVRYVALSPGADLVATWYRSQEGYEAVDVWRLSRSAAETRTAVQ